MCLFGGHQVNLCMFSLDIDPGLIAMSLSYLVPMMWYLNTAGRLSGDLGSMVGGKSKAGNLPINLAV